jgi:hypothetical protein
VRLGVVLVALAAAAALVPSGAARHQLRTRPVQFTTLWHKSAEGTGKSPYFRQTTPAITAYVYERIADAQYAAPIYLSKAHLDTLDRFAWSKRFLLLASVVRPTTGYSITIKRITYQHVSAQIQQFCVIAAIKKPRPNEPMERRLNASIHVVQIPRRGFGFTITHAVVLRDVSGKLLWKGYDFVRPALCKA